MTRITEGPGDIFKAPPNSVLIHACNCKGSWGAGVALAFKRTFPRAYEIYHDECNTPPSPFHQRSLLGTALLIPPQEEDIKKSGNEGYWIACIFTSVDTGAKKATVDVCLGATKKAMGDLQRKLKFTKARGADPGELWAVRLNSGLFNVPWPRTKRILEQCGMNLKIAVPEDEWEKETRKLSLESPRADAPAEAEAPAVDPDDLKAFETWDANLKKRLKRSENVEEPKKRKRKAEAEDTEPEKAVTMPAAAEKERKRKKRMAVI